VGATAKTIELLGAVSGELSGGLVRAAGDIDGDGRGDVLVGASGTGVVGNGRGVTYIVDGQSLSGAVGSSWSLSLATYAFGGEAVGDRSGTGLASAGDVDGDGLDDILIGAPLHDQVAISAGKTYLFLGATLAALGPGASVDLSSADFSFLGEANNDFSGEQVASAGDVDGDGFADLLIGARGNAEGGYAAGKAYVFLGATINAADLGTSFSLANADYGFVGQAPEDGAGTSVAGAGDLDNDGLSDLLIGAPGHDQVGIDAGKSYVLLGSTVMMSAPGTVLNLGMADYMLLGEAPGDFSGAAVAWAGDYDDDGRDDVIIGAPFNDEGGGVPDVEDGAGKVYVVRGSTLVGAGAIIGLGSMADLAFVGEAEGDFVGTKLARAGDLDGDGATELLVGAPGHDEVVTDEGRAYLILGSTAAVQPSGSSFLLSEADAIFVGQGVGDMSGGSVAGAGDIDGDGLDDILIGAQFSDVASDDAGASYVVLSPY